MTFSASILPVFEQLGLLEEACKLSLPFKGLQIYSMDMKLMGDFDFRKYKEKTGYDTILFARPEMHHLLLSKIPPNKILIKKKILSQLQNEHGVMIRCADNTTYHGDILVGADGAYSAVRQCLYKQAEKAGVLPKCDTESLNVGHVCMVGVTDPLDPEKYPALKDDVSHFERIIGAGTTHSWATSTVPGNRVCWLLTDQLDSSTASKEAMFKNSEWGPEANASMIRAYYDYQAPIGGTMGEIIDATPAELISKVFLEEKLFETWHYGRTVLIGDACHKFLPSGGQGAVNAMQDAVILANCLYDISDPTPENILTAFKSYRSQRYDQTKYQMDKCRKIAKMIWGQTIGDKIFRHVAFHCIPKAIQTRMIFKDTSYRPQVMFLPRIPNRGTVDVLPQIPYIQPLVPHPLKVSKVTFTSFDDRAFAIKMCYMCFSYGNYTESQEDKQTLESASHGDTSLTTAPSVEPVDNAQVARVSMAREIYRFNPKPVLIKVKRMQYSSMAKELELTP
ncbi:hypothetical protein BGW38_000935 [Lunasporangiospora selenospora]|uniref:FAD-binding domain-containing protein n=1 Tax=Lunasporangiospora selenospora TaxID=979761 RepID=A0A9P6FWA4_9FUNG|nr:hypothetical protein BGW38_000935 [Lunasporangiospora selenospora]